MKRALAAVLVAAFAACGAWAQSEEVAKPDPAVEARLKPLAQELRCLVCQNQTLADSNAPLAQDLRNEIRELIARGQTDDQIREYLVQRYGDFVLYRPPLKENTLALWLGPFALLVAGAFVFVRIVRARGKRAAQPAGAAPGTGEVEALLGRDD
ncbi:MAG TPA: cytochrome c-type biogenesis protein [Usitatibacter sp.]|jgi:cytochrome c-type biogenesis protein CcmH|nr:cytochrome c-type biogenesis protein [Usitatibacter sp.]